jgi:hypothetical protein
VDRSTGYVHQGVWPAHVRLTAAKKMDLAAQYVERFVPVVAVRRRARALVSSLQRDSIALLAALEASTVTCVPTTLRGRSRWSGVRTKNGAFMVLPPARQSPLPPMPRPDARVVLPTVRASVAACKACWSGSSGPALLRLPCTAPAPTRQPRGRPTKACLSHDSTSGMHEVVDAELAEWQSRIG